MFEINQDMQLLNKEEIGKEKKEDGDITDKGEESEWGSEFSGDESDDNVQPKQSQKETITPEKKEQESTEAITASGLKLPGFNKEDLELYEDLDKWSLVRGLV